MLACRSVVHTCCQHSFFTRLRPVSSLISETPEEAIEQDERVEVELERPDNVQAPRDPELQYFPENASSEAKLRHQRQGHVPYWSECPVRLASGPKVYLLRRPDPLWTPSWRVGGLSK